MTNTIYMIINSMCEIGICFVIINVIQRQKEILKEIDKLKNDR